MNVYDLAKMELDPDTGGNCGAFHENDLFNARVIILKPGQGIQGARMDSHVLFHVIEGEVTLTSNDETAVLRENHVFISGPAVLTMTSRVGARLLGVRISNRN